MHLWLDDVRMPTDRWIWVRTATEAIELLKTGKVTTASLDHDLGGKPMVHNGPDGLSGTDVINWMEANNVWPARVIIHSHNPYKGPMMARVAARYTNAIYFPYTGREI